MATNQFNIDFSVYPQLQSPILQKQLIKELNDWVTGVKGAKERAMKILGHKEKEVMTVDLDIDARQADIKMKKIYEGGQQVEKQIEKIINRNFFILSPG